MIIETMSPLHAAKPSRARPTPRPRRLFLLAASCCYLAIVTGVWLWLREYGDRAWLATVLLLSPRWPLAAPLVVLWPWVLLRRRWTPAIVTVGATGVVALGLLGVQWSWSWPGGADARAGLRIVTCNVHRQHLDAAAFRQYISTVEPDVIALQGWSDINMEALFDGGGWEIHREGELLVASRFPIGEVTPLDFADTSGVSLGERGSAACFELHTPRGPVFLINLHLASPHAGLLTFSRDSGDKLAENVRRRRRESEMVREMADRVRGPLLLTGDFNTTDDSPIFREQWGEFTDAFHARGWGLGYTYVVGHTQLRIDHILADSSWEVVRCWLGPRAGSPHRPLVADINFR